MTPLTIKAYRRSIHDDNERILASCANGRPATDPTSGKPLRTISNDSINKTLRTLALILDEAEDAGWVNRNVARGRRTREPVRRRKGDVLEPDEFLDLLGAARQLDREQHKPETLVRAERVRDYEITHVSNGRRSLGVSGSRRQPRSICMAAIKPTSQPPVRAKPSSRRSDLPAPV